MATKHHISEMKADFKLCGNSQFFFLLGQGHLGACTWHLTDGFHPALFHLKKWGRYFFLGVYKRHYLLQKNYQMWANCVMESSELQSLIPVECLPIPGKKQYHLDVCHATNGTHIDIYW